MDILSNPKLRYGPLPESEQAEKMLRSHDHLHTQNGAMEYLEKHLSRVKEYYWDLADKDKNIWSVLQRLKTRKLFFNTTKALRVIMAYHKGDLDLLNRMAGRIEQEPWDNELDNHYRYLLSLLEELRNSQTE
jgi:hypothetical protein